MMFANWMSIIDIFPQYHSTVTDRESCFGIRIELVIFVITMFFPVLASASFA